MEGNKIFVTGNSECKVVKTILLKILSSVATNSSAIRLAIQNSGIGSIDGIIFGDKRFIRFNYVYEESSFNVQIAR